jgi:hypothetical protein
MVDSKESFLAAIRQQDTYISFTKDVEITLDDDLVIDKSGALWLGSSSNAHRHSHSRRALA